MARKYFTLCTREGGQWVPQFGDYDRDVVAQEREDSYSEVRRQDWRIVESGAKQADINAAVARLGRISDGREVRDGRW